MPVIDVYNMEGKNLRHDRSEREDLRRTGQCSRYAFGGPEHICSTRGQGTQSTLTRSEVAGGGRKPWETEGAPAAPDRVRPVRPQWTKGGIALGPQAQELPGFP